MYKVTHPPGHSGQWICGIVVGLCGFVSGLGLGWVTVFYGKLDSGEVEKTFTVSQRSWFATIAHIGQLGATFPSGYLQDKFGRRTCLLLVNQAMLFSWILLLVSCEVWSVMLSRFLVGVYSGFAVTCCPAYMGEVAGATRRGRLSALLTICFTIGLLFQTSIGSFISYNAIAILSLCLTFAHFIALLNVPDSPYSLLRCGKVEQAEKNLKWLRGKKDVKEDFNYIKYHVDLQMSRKSSFKDICKWPASRRAFVQAVSLILVQRLTGFTALTSFTSQIFPEDWSILKSHQYPIMWNAVNVIFIVITFCLLDYVDRKILLMISTVGCTVTGTILIVWFYLYEKTNVDMSGTIWIPYIALTMHAAFYAFGLLLVAIVYLGEIFPINVKAKAITVVSFISYIAVIFVVKIFLPLKEYVGMYSNFVIYSVSSLIGCFVCTIITETRKRSLEFIQSKLEREPSEVYLSRKRAMAAEGSHR